MSAQLPFNVNYLSHRVIKTEDDITYFVRVNITGNVLLRNADNQYLEGIVSEVYVPKTDCRSDSPEDLLRCATRRIAQLATEAHSKCVREMQ